MCRAFQGLLWELDPRTHQLHPTRTAPGSTDWITSNAAYSAWLNDPNGSLLHIYGPPGSGRTALSSEILKSLKTAGPSRSTSVFSFAFDRWDSRCNSARSLFLSLSRQILGWKPSLFRHVKRLCRLLSERPCFTREELWALACSLLNLSARRSVFCIVNAVDECGPTWECLVDELAGLVGSTGAPLKILLTSATLPGERPGTASYRTIRLPEESTMEDAIRHTVGSRVARLLEKRPVWQDFKHGLVEKLCGGQRTYFDAMLEMDFLEHTKIPSTRAALLSHLMVPAYSREKIFEQMLLHQAPEEGRRALNWIFHALRPLRLRELSVALALDACATSTLTADAFEWLEQNISWSIAEDLREMLGPVIKVVDDEVHFVHRTFRSFLEGSPFVDRSYSYTIVERCLDYLSIVTPHFESEMMGNGGSRHHLTFESGHQLAGFLPYAVRYWPEHYKLAESDPALDARVIAYLEPGGIVSPWSTMYGALAGPASGDEMPRSDPLAIASRLGLTPIVKMLITGPRQAGLSNGGAQVALDLAARQGHVDVVRELLREGIKSGEALHRAAESGHVEVLGELLEAGFSANEKDESGSTPLLLASRHGQTSVINRLLQGGASTNVASTDGSTPLHLAAQLGQKKLVEALIDSGADPMAYNADHYNPMQLVAESGFSEVAQILVSKIDPNARMDGTLSPLHLAAAEGHLTLAKVLIENGANVATNVAGVTPLHLASKEGHLSVVRELLAGVDPTGSSTTAASDIEDEVGVRHLTPLQLAAQNGHVDVVMELLARGVNPPTDDLHPPVHLAAAAGHLDVVTEMLKGEASVTEIDQDGKIALHLAAASGHIEVVKKLVALGSDIEARSPAGLTPLHMAAEAGQLRVTRYLVSSYAQINALTDADDTPLHLAAGRGHALVVRELLRRVDDDEIARENIDGFTPLHLAAAQGHVDVVRELLRQKAQLLLTDPTRLPPSPLLASAKEGRTSIVELLLESGWPCDCQDEVDNTPLQLASAGGSASTVELLLRRGADASMTNGIGATALHLAIQNNQVNIAKTLLRAGADSESRTSTVITPSILPFRKVKWSLSRRCLTEKLSMSTETVAGAGPPSTQRVVISASPRCSLVMGLTLTLQMITGQRLCFSLPRSGK